MWFAPGPQLPPEGPRLVVALALAVVARARRLLRRRLWRVLLLPFAVMLLVVMLAPKPSVRPVFIGTKNAPIPSSQPSGACQWCSYYGSFSNGLKDGFTAGTAYPLAIWLQCPGCAGSSGSWGYNPIYTSSTGAAAGTGINIYNDFDTWPSSFGVDQSSSGTGQLQAACDAGIPTMAGGDVRSNTSAESVASVLAVANGETQAGTGKSCAQFLFGYSFDDEPDPCTVVPDVPTGIANIHADDPTRIAFQGMASWVTHGNQECGATIGDTAFAAPDIPASDQYHNTDPWSTGDCSGAAHVTTSPWTDCVWQYGVQANVQAQIAPSKPTWIDEETGNDVFGWAQQAGSVCTEATNVCTVTGETPHELNATLPQVNADAWSAIINGSAGIIWFCHGGARGDPDTYSNCLGNSGFASANTINANLAYVNSNINAYAPVLDRVNDGFCTMVPSTRATFNNALATSCTGGNLSISTSLSTEPLEGMTKLWQGKEYLFVITGRGNGTTTGTYTIAGHGGQTATCIYDSAAHYDPAISEQGSTFALNGSGQFSDTLTGDIGQGSDNYGAGANSYQVKIYTIS